MSFEQVNPATTSDSTDGYPQGAQYGASVVFVGATDDSNVLTIDLGNGGSGDFASSGPHPIVRSTGEIVTNSPVSFDLEDPEWWSSFEDYDFLSLLYGDNESVSVSNQDFQTPVIDLDSTQMCLHNDALQTPTHMVPTRLFGPDTDAELSQVVMEFDHDSFDINLDFDSSYGNDANDDNVDDNGSLVFGDDGDVANYVNVDDNGSLVFGDDGDDANYVNVDDNGSLVFGDDGDDANDDNDFRFEGLSLLAPDVTCGDVDCATQGICGCGIVPFSPITPNFASVCACNDCCDGNYCPSWTSREVRAHKTETEDKFQGLHLQLDHFDLMQPEQPDVSVYHAPPVIPEPTVQPTSGRPKRARLTDIATVTVSSSLDAQEVTVSFDDKVVDLDNEDRDARRKQKSDERRAKKLERVYDRFCRFSTLHVARCNCTDCRNRRG